MKNQGVDLELFLTYWAAWFLCMFIGNAFFHSYAGGVFWSTMVSIAGAAFVSRCLDGANRR